MLFINKYSIIILPSHKNLTSPDLTIALDAEWRTPTTLSSDLLPILVQLGSAYQMNLQEPPIAI